jgi:hypothetical protein
MSILGIAGLVLGGGGIIGLLVASAPVMGFLVGIVGPKAAKPVFYIVGAALLALALWGAWATWLHHHDKGVIAQHDAAIDNATNAEVAAGTNQANAADAVKQAEDQARSNAVNVAINNAVAAHPVETHHATGPASQAALNALRNRRTKR